MSDSGAPKRAGFDVFELFAALLLGAGVVGVTWSAWQGSLWGATADAAFAGAAELNTQASAAHAAAVEKIGRDTVLDMRGKELVLEAITTKDPLVRERNMLLAKYLYTQQVSAEGYAALGLPADYRTADKTKAASLPDGAVIGGLDKDLGEPYRTKVLAVGAKVTEEAAAAAASAAEATSAGDRFGMDGVMFAFALFLAGIGLAARSGVRWLFFILAVFVFGAATSYLFLLEWAEFQWPWA